MAVFRAPARFPMGASRPHRMQPAGWPPSGGNGNCLSEPPAPNPRVEAPAKRAERARKREKQVIGKAPFGGRSGCLERPQPSPTGVSFPRRCAGRLEPARREAGTGGEVRVPGRGQAQRGGCHVSELAGRQHESHGLRAAWG